MNGQFNGQSVTNIDKETFDGMVLEWDQAKKQLDIVKAKEIELRRKIVFECGRFTAQKQEGAETLDLGSGWKLKATKKINYSVANKDGEAFDVLAKLTAMGSETVSFLAEKLFSFDARLSTTNYKELGRVNSDAQRLVNQIVTTKEGTPELELKAPPKA